MDGFNTNAERVLQNVMYIRIKGVNNADCSSGGYTHHINETTNIYTFSGLWEGTEWFTIQVGR